MPTIQNEDASLPKGRNRTDKSLKAERAKTDESLSQERHQTEVHADEAVSLNRARADEERSRTRIEADNSCVADRAFQGGSSPEERLETDERLSKERQIADEALYLERRQVDSILESERWRKKAAERKLFQAERKETDKDLTSERNLTDAEVQRSVAALTTRDEFLAIVSHDLRNPLGSISIAADLLTESPIYAKADDEERQYIAMIGRNASEALRLISDLLDMERIAVGKLGLEVGLHNVSEIFEHAVKTFQHQADTKNISLRVSAQEANVLVKCDRDRISQVLSNLIGNAIKFTPQGGAITLAVGLTGQDAVQISVADTGPGIPEDMLKKVFERFWQIGKRDRRGLGLGLYISTMIVEAHGGRMWVDSKVGKGSIFHFTLPKRREDIVLNDENQMSTRSGGSD